uniref:Uncharacterized protein n=1 Tax=Anguilla anguilla TaxID=7936 RepID=A0A0E9U348_ANGAN
MELKPEQAWHSKKNVLWHCLKLCRKHQ